MTGQDIAGYRTEVERPKGSNGGFDASVSLIIPIRNEAVYIDACIAAATAQDYPPDLIEIVVVDGDSDDGTPAIIQRWADRDRRIRVLRNPKRLMIPGLNLGLSHTSASYVGYVNGHSFPPPDYVRRCIALLDQQGAWGVGGTYDRVATRPLQRAIARAQSHPFGVGDAVHNYGNEAQWAETVFPGFWPRWVFERVGPFDERMLYNEDNELSHRIRSAGGRLWYEPSIRIGYSPRTTLRGLFRQYFNYGAGKIAVFRQHRDAVRARHLVPAALVALLVGGIVIIPFAPTLTVAALFVLMVYVVAVSVAAGSASRDLRSFAMLGVSFVVMHIAYGLGTWAGVARLFRGTRRIRSEH